VGNEDEEDGEGSTGASWRLVNVLVAQLLFAVRPLFPSTPFFVILLSHRRSLCISAPGSTPSFVIYVSYSYLY
jgi:hypothetical protein